MTAHLPDETTTDRFRSAMQQYDDARAGTEKVRAQRLRDLKMAASLLLRALGEDIDRPGIRETPERVAKMWDEFINFDPGKIETVFEHTTADQMILVTGMKLWSMCEHHLLPFSMIVSVGYIPRSGRIIGLSKLARIAHKHAHRLQVQERFVEQVADEIGQRTGSGDVAVVAGAGSHLCMEMRGIRTPASMICSALRGAFRDGPVRAEFLSLASSSLAR